MRNFILTFLFIPVLFLSGCASPPTVPENPKGITVYTGFYTMFDFTKKIGGDKINIVDFVPPGAEPHDWEPSPGDIIKLENASLLVVNGNGMEHWLDKVNATVKNNSLTVLETSDYVDIIDMDETGGTPADPHVWLDPQNAKKQLEAIKNTLGLLDPVNRDYYESNFLDCSARLDTLDEKFKTAAESFAKKDLIVSHGAFGYLCRRYGLNQIALERAEGDGDVTPSRMIEMVDFIKSNNIKYIFTEPLEASKAMEAVAKEAGAEILVLDPIESVSKDDDNPEDYFERMEENLTVLEKALN